MRGVRIPHDLNGEDQFVLGLSVPRLAAVLLGLLAAYTILHLSLPAPVQVGAATLAALTGAAIAWVRPEGRSLIHWAVAAIEFKLSERPRLDKRGVADDPHVRSGTAYQVKSNPATATYQPSLRVITAASTPALPAPEQPVEAEPEVIEIGGELDNALADSASDENPSLPPAPVYLGGPQLITFFSAKGGTGRTTLATEVASLLAMKGRYRESASSGSQPLNVALIDFDLASANVSARLGLAQPTMLDYLCDATVQSPNPMDFVIHHPPTNLDVLLGPSKCLAGDRSDLIGVAQAAHILTALKAAGYQFIILDLSASLGDLETYLLEAATQIYCVVTPTAGSVQSLYRGVEALRRLGLGGKLQYVANKMRDGISLSIPMSDLNGSLVARVPYDVAFEAAENRHRPFALHGHGPAFDALLQLAAAIFPALQAPLTGRTGISPFAWLGRRRRAG
ncbi:MAG TPA: AAA family ATPase [Candidatus Dormibacteraeota bacterium]|nr:AAA family ATPase [Candidatus Dormibacteraeota bacterium]